MLAVHFGAGNYKVEDLLVNLLIIESGYEICFFRCKYNL